MILDDIFYLLKISRLCQTPFAHLKCELPGLSSTIIIIIIVAKYVEVIPMELC